MTERNTIASHLAVRLRSLRLRERLTQVELSKIARCSPWYVIRLEGGKSVCSLGQLVRLADALGVTPAQILEGL